MRGLAHVSSLGGSHYYVMFINESVKNVWIYFLKNKSDVFVIFKKWNAMVEPETSSGR